MHNLYAQFKSLLPNTPLMAGTVVATHAGVAVVELPGGAQIQARGSASVGQQVFVRDGAIEGVASTLPRLDQEV